MRRLPIILTIVLVAGVLSSCGFHLRGQVRLADAVSKVYIKSPDPRLAREVEDQLRASGYEPAGAGGASAIVDVLRADYFRNVRSVDARGKATGYRLRYEVDFRVRGAGGKTLLDTQYIRQERDYNFDPTQILAKESEEAYLRDDMVKDVARQILRQLAAIR